MRYIQNIAANITIVAEWMGFTGAHVCRQIGKGANYLTTAKHYNATGELITVLKFCNWIMVPVDEVLFKDFAVEPWSRLKKPYDINNMPRLDDQLRDIAKIYKVSVEDLCEAVELSPDWARNSRRAKTNPKTATAYTIAENLGITVEELIFGNFKEADRWKSRLSSLEFL